MVDLRAISVLITGPAVLDAHDIVPMPLWLFVDGREMATS